MDILSLRKKLYQYDTNSTYGGSLKIKKAKNSPYLPSANIGHIDS